MYLYRPTGSFSSRSNSGCYLNEAIVVGMYRELLLYCNFKTCIILHNMKVIIFFLQGVYLLAAGFTKAKLKLPGKRVQCVCYCLYLKLRGFAPAGHHQWGIGKYSAI